MAKQGKCINIDCEHYKEVFDIPAGEEFVCPHCHQTLGEVFKGKTKKIGGKSDIKRTSLIAGCVMLLFALMYGAYTLYTANNEDRTRVPIPPIKTDTVVIIQRDTIIKVQYSSEAEQRYRADAERGDAAAQFALGCNYYAGEKGLPQSYSEAVKWYKKAAAQGYAPAQNNLGYCYECGYGVSKNLDEAKKLYEKAAAQGDNTAKKNLERIKNLKKAANAPKVVELTIPAPSWNGKVLHGEFKDKLKLREKKNALNKPVTLSLKEWLKENNLIMEYGSYTKNSNGKFEGEKPLNVELNIFPEEYKGKKLKEYEYRGNLCTAFYADNYWKYNYLIIFDAERNILYKLDFALFTKAPYTKPGDEEYVSQGVRFPNIIGNTLYIQHGHYTYAYSSGNKNAYISAIDLTSGKILWTTQPLTCNSDFIIIDNTIICGYGFSAEPDYVYLVDLGTGKRRQSIKVASAPDYIVKKGGQIYVLTYDHHYVFDIINR